MQTSLAQTFNETAAAAYAAFPRQLQRLVILMTPSSDTPVYVSPAIADQLTKNTADIKKAVEYAAQRMRDKTWTAMANKNYDLAGTSVNLIALSENPNVSVSARCTKEMKDIFFLDHEIGHHILKNGYFSAEISRQQAEAAADAYAMLRHIQRFGKNTDHAAFYDDDRASRIILLSDPEHYTADAIQGAIRLADEMDISGLSLRETAALAEKIADKYRMDDETLDKICKAFEPAAEIFKEAKGWNGACLKEVVEAMRKHKKDPDIVMAGKRFFNIPSRKEFVTKTAKTDPYWQEARKYLLKVEKKFPRRSLLQRLGLKH